MNSYISSIGTATPANRMAQQEVSDFMAEAHEMNEEEKGKLKALYRATGIRNRYSVVDDFSRRSETLFSLNQNGGGFPGTGQRMDLFKEKAVELSKNSVKNCLDKIDDFSADQITHLITVSCTGLYAPGLDIDLIEQLGLNPHIQRTGINYMGCYAALTAIKTADAICQSDPEAWVLITCVELCTIHFQREKTEDNILAQAIFGDGAASILMHSRPTTRISLNVESSFCDLIPEGKTEMAWGIGDFGFEMKLSTYVPDMIKRGIHCLTKNLLQSMSLDLNQIRYLAVHPGGKKILQVIEEELGFKKEQNAHSHNILSNYGNMSSPTILFVLNSIWQEISTQDHGSHILSFAFGPGLTLESMVLRINIQ